MNKKPSQTCSMLADKYRSPLKLNEEKRYNHDECGDTRERLYVRRTKSGWLFHCHNCAPKLSGFMRDDLELTPNQTIKKLSEVVDVAKKIAGQKGLPADFSPDIPTEGWMWLRKYGILDKEVSFYGIGYSNQYSRLVLPVYNLAGLVAWQGRALGKIDKKYPKYMTMTNGAQSRLWFDSRHGIKQHREYLETNKIVLVEDIISAIKLGRQFRTIALLGSYVREELIDWMLAVNKANVNMTFYIWLDPDKMVESYKIAGRLRSLGLRVITITTSQDPKDEDGSTIETLIR